MLISNNLVFRQCCRLFAQQCFEIIAAHSSLMQNKKNKKLVWTARKFSPNEPPTEMQSISFRNCSDLIKFQSVTLCVTGSDNELKFHIAQSSRSKHFKVTCLCPFPDLLMNERKLSFCTFCPLFRGFCDPKNLILKTSPAV